MSRYFLVKSVILGEDMYNRLGLFLSHCTYSTLPRQAKLNQANYVPTHLGIRLGHYFSY